ncbi:hypothetical protein GGX14DRAFT_589280 [Mycena pura]|uniref:DNA replication regulator SLD2 n=1 Tax=Mycena pura TaxID=153505 RepID=A0AAD6US16_9AGAR|nr:hypothetical protein GGX14DRAFT_589280 [Mycena pura]
MDVAALRTEIKTWERSFRAAHGRDPSVQDIKDQPGLAERYRQYKKLTKETVPPKKRPTPPSTPPRSQSRDSTFPSLLLSKPRSITATEPLPGYNPFSPQKSKAKQKDLNFDVSSRSLGRKPSPIPILSKPDTSKDPFAPTPNKALSRARKRLRGEPVSPSPNKGKRRRLIPSQENSDDDDDEHDAANTSFVDDSPVKPPIGVRSFKLLFDEAPDKPRFPLRSNTLLSGLQAGDKMDIDVPPHSPLASASKGPQNDPFIDSGKEGHPSMSDDDMTDYISVQPRALTSALLPPSPPPAARHPSSQSRLHNGKGRGRPLGEGSKKVKTSTSHSDDDDESDDANGSHSRQKIRSFKRTLSRRRANADDFDEDAYHIVARRPPERDIVEIQNSESISLPDTLRSVLSLASTSSRGHEDEHVVEQLIYGTRRGNFHPSKGGEIWGVGEFEGEHLDEFAPRTRVYDGGSTTGGAYDEEDEWEGEGVPWEVGEL